jgi:hypothetical protein
VPVVSPFEALNALGVLLTSGMAGAVAVQLSKALREVLVERSRRKTRTTEIREDRKRLVAVERERRITLLALAELERGQGPRPRRQLQPARLPPPGR